MRKYVSRDTRKSYSHEKFQEVWVKLRAKIEWSSSNKDFISTVSSASLLQPQT